MEEEPSFEELLEQLNHDDWKVRKQEIDKIRKFKDVDSYFALRKLLNDENEDVRRSASKVFLNEEIFSKLLNIERKLMSSYNRFSEGYYNKQDDTGYCDSIEEINASINPPLNVLAKAFLVGKLLDWVSPVMKQLPSSATANP